MKNIKIAFSAIVISSMLLTSSCNDDYLNTAPSESIDSKTVFDTAESLSTSVNGMIRMMYTNQNSSQGNNGYTGQMIIADVMGDDVIFPSTASNWFVSELRWISQASAASRTSMYPWNFWASIIRNANNIITYGTDAKGDQNLKTKSIGQAYAFRAFGNFQLVQLYAKRYAKDTPNSQLGIVLRTDPKDIAPKTRATVEEVYALIWEDLTKAEELLTGKRVKNNSEFSLETVLGLKARVALVKQDYQNAVVYAKLARQSKQLMTQSEYVLGFNDYQNREWMWGVTIQADQSAGFGNFMAYMSRNYTSTPIRQAPRMMNVKLYEAFPKSDVRTKVVKPDGKHPDLNLATNYTLYPYTSQKFITAKNDNSSSLGDVVFMRASEMYLIEAEALYHLGNEAESKVVLNQLVSARDNDFIGYSETGTAYLNKILLNRRIELWGEGFRFFDLKRLNSDLDRTGTNQNETVIQSLYKVDANSWKWQWLIPQGELDSNPLVEQNPSSEK